MQIFLFINLIFTKNYAILLNASQYFFNYRHTSNVLTLHKILKQNGFLKEEIIHLTCEDVTRDMRNAHIGYFHHTDKKYFKSPKIKTTQFSINTFLNMLRCNDIRLKDVDESSNILIYMCGHGGKGYIKFHDREYLLREDLMAGLEALYNRGVNKILFIFDTCNADSLIDPTRLKKNMLLVASSKTDELSYSFHYSQLIGPALIDNFMLEFYRLAIHADKKTQIVDLLQKMQHIGSTIIWHVYDKKNFLFKDFFYQSEDEKKLIPFKVE
ncbi:GPI-anchor transamidase [Astathelohania contejeani]|uniref:GPI-anchor transamidase n=1 Tax=Astathelohania contejeani TaxID=164912 RepID=A0ABQ7HWD2_9MICR|nr:GPI-anchor transamidase [Thelohania contejeani]